MCFPSVKTPEPIKIEKPVYVRNPFLDDEDDKARTADAMRRGRSSLVIPSGTGIGFEGAGGSVEAGAGGAGGAPISGPGTIPGSGTTTGEPAGPTTPGDIRDQNRGRRGGRRGG